MKKILLLLLSIWAFPILSMSQCTLSAGNNQTGCVGTTFFASASANQYTTFAWSSSGTGTFANPASVSTVYFPSSADAATGTVTVTITASGGGCTAKSQYLSLAILPLPSITVGFNQTICAGNVVSLNPTTADAASINWGTSGSGTFSPNAQSTNAIYTPSEADITSGSVMVFANVISAFACASPMDDLIVSIIHVPIVSAGVDQISCGNPTALNATVPNGATLNWTSSGSGTFSSPSSPTATYVPSAADIANASVTLTATGTNTSGCTTSDQVIMSYPPSGTVTAGFDITICPSSPVNLSGAAATNTTSYLWTTSGTGTFSNNTVLQPVYQSSAADAAAGTVTLTLTGINNSGCTSTDNLIVTVVANNEYINAGPDQVIASGTASFTGTATGTSTISWSSNGTGSFNNTNSLSTTYTPSAADIANGIVKIKLASTAAGICIPTEDELLLTIGSDLTLSGNINASSNTLDKGVVLLFKQGTTGLNFIKSDTLIGSDNGSYAFNHIPAGTYVVLASPANGSLYMNTFLPTYSGGTQTWTTAESISITSTTAYNIALTAYTSADPSWNTGTDIISGLVDVSPANAANARTTLANIPAAYVTVYLTNASGNKIAYTQTDKYGRYSFKNVKAGNYKVMPEFVGTALAGSTTSLAIVSDGTPSTTENGSMSLVEKTSTSTGIINTTKSTAVRTYPNPVKTNFSMDVPVSTGTGEIKVFNETGTIKLQQQVILNNPTITVDIESLPAGIYLLQLVTENEIYTSKIVKY